MSRINIDKLLGSDTGLLLAAAAALAVVYYVGKHVLSGAANVAGGVVSGNNAITQGTVYQGTGVVGTLGAAANDASGGVLSQIGGSLGDALYNLFHPAEATAQSAQSASREQVVTNNYVNDLAQLDSPNFSLMEPASSYSSSLSGVNGDMGGLNFGTSGSGW